MPRTDPDEIDVFAELASHPPTSKSNRRVNDVLANVRTVMRSAEATAKSALNPSRPPKPKRKGYENGQAELLAGQSSSWHEEDGLEAPGQEPAELPFTAGAAALTLEQHMSLDQFLVHLYEFWFCNGFWSLVSSRASDMLTVLFVTAFVPFCASVIQWDLLMQQCTDSVSCAANSAMFVDFSYLKGARGGHALSWMFICTGSAYACWLSYRGIIDVKRAHAVSVFCSTVLNIPDDDMLQSLRWDDVVQRVNDAACQFAIHRRSNRENKSQNVNSSPLNLWEGFLIICDRHTGPDTPDRQTSYQHAPASTYDEQAAALSDSSLPFAASPQRIPAGKDDARVNLQATPSVRVTGREGLALINAEEIAARILRRDNFLTAVIANAQLHLSLPSSGDEPASTSGKVYAPYTKLMEWSLMYALIPTTTGAFTRQRFHQSISVAEIQRRMVFLGCILLVSSPFVFMFAIIYYGSHQIGDMYSSKDYTGPRRWSLYALRLFRGYDELPHVLQHRLLPSFPLAQKFLEHAHSSAALQVGQFFTVVTGSLFVLIALIGVLNENFTLYVLIGGRNLLWYLTLFGAALSVSRALSGEARAVQGSEVEDCLKELALYTHYMPRSWSVNNVTMRSASVSSAVAGLFPFRVQLFVQEVIGTLLIPIFLLVWFPRQAPRLASFLREHAVFHPIIGVCCAYSLVAVALAPEGSSAANNPAPDADHQTKLALSAVAFVDAHPTSSFAARSDPNSWASVRWSPADQAEFEAATKIGQRKQIAALLLRGVENAQSRGQWVGTALQSLSNAPMR
jgi:hypothetical protein